MNDPNELVNRGVIVESRFKQVCEFSPSLFSLKCHASARAPPTVLPFYSLKGSNYAFIFSLLVLSVQLDP